MVLLPEGVLEDDGADRGFMFAFSEHISGGNSSSSGPSGLTTESSLGAGSDKDPVIGSNGDGGNFTVPRKPVRRRIQGIPNFVVTRGGEYCFMPGMRALRWLAELET